MSKLSSIVAVVLVACTAGDPATPAGGGGVPDDTGPVDSGQDSGGGDDTAAPLPTIVINELMADNESGLLTEANRLDDWIELYNAGSEAVDLGGMTVSDDYEDPELYELPVGLALEPGGILLLWAVGDEVEELADNELPFRLSAGGEGLGLFTADGDMVEWVVFPPLGGDEARARLPDGAEHWEEMPGGTPGASNLPMEWRSEDLVEKGATWSYDDSGVDLGTAWREPGYDDSAWATGAAPLGYGDSHVATEVSYGDDSGAKHPTTYFRKTVSLASLPTEAELEVLLDDGAVIWINGQESLRSNLEAGEVSYGTYATDAISGSSETAYAQSVVAPDLFVVGDNVLAVEVHQATAGSSDLGFDLTLTTWVLAEAE